MCQNKIKMRSKLQTYDSGFFQYKLKNQYQMRSQNIREIKFVYEIRHKTFFIYFRVLTDIKDITDINSLHFVNFL